jgi:uncharacterized 2Fe-2S/4Fe-4S cluster protein (DUF4445 family)
MNHTGEKEKEAAACNGWVRNVSLHPPTLHDNTSDADRLKYALKKELKTERVDMDLTILKQLPFFLREWDYSVRCVLIKDKDRWIVTGLTARSSHRVVSGLAVDLGTSRVVLRLIDLETGAGLTELAFDNPQLAVGPDVLSRVHACDQQGGLEKLNRLIIDGLNQHIEKLCRSCGLGAEDIYLVSLAGNTCMTHLFMGLPPHWIIREPYIPVINMPGMEKTSAFGLQVNPCARIVIFPNIGSYFGGDLVSGILFSDMHRSRQTSILVDVGTNAEVVLGNENWLIACAGAAGPALEGGVTRMGMMAGPGVVDQVAIDPESKEIHIHTIGEKPPVGICGSGLIDLAAQLFLAGMVDIRGKFVSRECGDRLTEASGVFTFEVVPAETSGTQAPISISQVDLESLIRSKAAMYTILETITATVNMSPIDLTTFYVAGTFGSFIKPASAVSIGMLPDLADGSYKSLGNSSLQGAAKVLTACDSLDEIDRIRDKITYLELNVNQEFMNRFSAAKFLPHTNRALFPSVIYRLSEKRSG